MVFWRQISVGKRFQGKEFDREREVPTSINKRKHWIFLGGRQRSQWLFSLVHKMIGSCVTNLETKIERLVFVRNFSFLWVRVYYSYLDPREMSFLVRHNVYSLNRNTAGDTKISKTITSTPYPNVQLSRLTSFFVCQAKYGVNEVWAGER